MKCLYFGCWEQAGHYFWRGDGRGIVQEDFAIDRHMTYERHIDGGMCPLPKDGEGIAVHHVDGWTVVSFWDRTVDTRGACNSSFMVDALVSAQVCIEAGAAQFPRVWARVKHLVAPYIYGVSEEVNNERS